MEALLDVPTAAINLDDPYLGLGKLLFGAEAETAAEFHISGGASVHGLFRREFPPSRGRSIAIV